MFVIRNSSVLEWDGCLKMTVHSAVHLTAQTPSRNTSDQMGACLQVREHTRFAASCSDKNYIRAL